MKIKKLLILVLIAFRVNADVGDLESLTSNLTNFEAKSAELDKIEAYDYQNFYKKLRIAIRQSLITRELDNSILGPLPNNTAKRTAEYILERLFELKHETPYNIAQNNITLTLRNYTELIAPLDNIVDQILLIARIIDYIFKNYKPDEDISILSIDSFSGVFNTYFALAFFSEQTKRLTPGTGKLNLTILSNSLDDNDLVQITNDIEKMGYKANRYETIWELLKALPHFDTYIVIGDKNIVEGINNAIEITNQTNQNYGLIFPKFTKVPSQALAIVKPDTPENERNAIFGNFIKSILNINVEYDVKEVADYKPTGKIQQDFWIPFIISHTANMNKNSSQLFIIDHSKIWDLSLPIADWPDLLYELTLVIYPGLKKAHFFKFDLKSKKFIQYDPSLVKRVKVRKITW